MTRRKRRKFPSTTTENGSPEKTAVFYTSAGKKSSCEAGGKIHGKDQQVYQAFPKAQLIKGKGKDS